MADSDRIPYITNRESVPEEHRHHFDSIDESRGSVRGPFAVLMNSPELAGRTGRLGAYIRFESTLADADRELAIITTARIFDCAYEWVAHRPIAEDAGVSDEAIDVVAEERPTDDLNEDESIVITYVRELLNENRISDKTFRQAHERFDDTGVTELTATCGYYAMNACTLNAFEVEPSQDRP